MKVNMKYFMAVVVVSLNALLVACAVSRNEPDHPLAGNSERYTFIEEGEVVEAHDNYKIVCSDHLYYYYILNGGEIVKAEGPLVRKPKIVMVEELLIKVVTQGGTGIGTQSGYYYDITHNLFSKTFPCIRDENNKRVAYTEFGKVIVRDIFDEHGYYFEISDFSSPFSAVATPITGAELSADNSFINISYLTGEGYDEITETVSLPQDRGQDRLRTGDGFA